MNIHASIIAALAREKNRFRRERPNVEKLSLIVSLCLNSAGNESIIVTMRIRIIVLEIVTLRTQIIAGLAIRDTQMTDRGSEMQQALNCELLVT